MASMAVRSSQRSPVTRTTGSSFLLPVIGATTALAVSGPMATIGLRPSVRPFRAKRTTWASLQTPSSGTTASGTSADPSVLSQNNNYGDSAVRCSKASNRGDARRQPSIPDQTWAKPDKVGEADKIAMTI